MKPNLAVACFFLKSVWQAVLLRSALTALLLAPLAVTAQEGTPSTPIALKDGVVPPRLPVAEAIKKAMVFFKKTDDGYVPARLDGTLAPYFTDAFMGIKDGSSLFRVGGRR